jgi:hypothetical protein
VDKSDLPDRHQFRDAACISINLERVLGRRRLEPDQLTADAVEVFFQPPACADDKRSCACGHERFGDLDRGAFGPACGEVRDDLKDGCAT